MSDGVHEERSDTAPGPLASGLSRRHFLAVAGGTFSAVGLAQAVDVLQAVAQSPLPSPLPDPASVRATMEAYADTIVPGPAGRGDPAPGAVEAGAVDEIYDPFYGAANAYSFLHEDIQLATPRILGRPATFDLSLPYPDRERVVSDRILLLNRGGSDPFELLYAAVAILVYVSYYGTARSDLGVRYIGLPPRSNGYYPHHSYHVRFRGMTEDGNPS